MFEWAKKIVKKIIPGSKGCQVCFNADAELANLADCGHGACKDCWANHIHTLFVKQKKGFLDIPCVACKATLSHDEFAQLIGDADQEYFEAYLKTIPEVGNTFDDFHYRYDENGELKNISSNTGFHWVSQAHYNTLGDCVVDHIQKLMRERYGLNEVFLPLDVPEDEVADTPRSNIFLSSDALENPDRLLLLIQGSGAVRPGQWARALCINNSLKTGTIFSYLEKAKEEGYGVIVFNPNMNHAFPPSAPKAAPVTREQFLDKKIRDTNDPELRKYLKAIPNNRSGSEHTLYVWDHFVKKAKAKHIAIVAHSAGGHCTTSILERRLGEETTDKIRAIAFTDSAHSTPSSKGPKELLKMISINWVASDKPLDTPEPENDRWSGCKCLSSGHEKHEWTSASAFPSVFPFLRKRIEFVDPDAFSAVHPASADSSSSSSAVEASSSSSAVEASSSFSAPAEEPKASEEEPKADEEEPKVSEEEQKVLVAEE